MSQRSEQVLLFTALHAAGVDYAVVGGVAVNAHGFVRNTRIPDLDIFIRPTVENAQAAFRLFHVSAHDSHLESDRRRVFVRAMAEGARGLKHCFKLHRAFFDPWRTDQIG